jgi:hypothetical protein
MSLINDALKKAQKQRTGEAPPLASMPSIGGESPAHIAKRAKPAGFNTLFLRVGIGAGALLIVLGVGAYYIFRSPAKATAAPSPQPAPVVATSLQQPSSPVAGPVKTGEPAPAFNLPIAAPPAVVEQPAPVPVTTAAPAQKAPAVPSVAAKPQPASPVAKTPDEPPVPVAPAKMDNKAVAYIENLRVAGIRASATDSKVLMNDRVYRLGDIVEREMGLKLIGITSSSMTFEDERGAKYTRNF